MKIEWRPKTWIWVHGTPVNPMAVATNSISFEANALSSYTTKVIEFKPLEWRFYLLWHRILTNAVRLPHLTLEACHDNALKWISNSRMCQIVSLQKKANNFPFFLFGKSFNAGSTEIEWNVFKEKSNEENLVVLYFSSDDKECIHFMVGQCQFDEK